MRPILLELQAFGPYKEKQTIDFAKLADQGMFLIKGPTGSGKTTIFDAMTFALYGGGSGDSEKTKTGRNDLQEWRCNQAEKDDPTMVSLTFEVDGHIYRFTRTLVLKRTNFSDSYEAGEVLADGTVVPLFENPKKADLNNKAQELVGLDKEQFRQVVLLPQGQFERFLTAESDEKEQILRKIFASGVWNSYVTVFFDRANEWKRQLDEEKNTVKISLAEDGLDTMEALGEKIEALQKEQEQSAAAHEAFNGETKSKQLNEDIALGEQFKLLHRYEADRNKVLIYRTNYEQHVERLKKAEKAEALRSLLEEYDRKAKAEKDRKSILEEKKKEIPSLEENEKTAREAVKEHTDNSPVAQLQTTIGLYSGKIETYETIGKLKLELSQKTQLLSRVKAEAEAAELAMKQAETADNEALRIYNEEDKRALEYRTSYLNGIYGEIAADLKEGEKCPVCGNVHHPEPAMKAPDSISKEEMEAQEAKAEAKKLLWKKAEEKFKAAQVTKSEKERILQQAQGEQIAADSAVKNASANMIEGIDSLSDLKKKIATLQGQIDAFEKETVRLNKALEAATNRLTEGKSGLAMAEKEALKAASEMENAKKTLIVAMQETGYGSLEEVRQQLMDAADRAKYQKQISGYEEQDKKSSEDLKRQIELLQGKTEPESTLFEQRQKEIREEESLFNRTQAGLKTEIDRLKHKNKELKKLYDHYTKHLQQAESDLAFARKLRGDSGIGLPRYVLAIMFNQVIGEANRMLEKVHGGRYRLFRSDDRTGGNKRGLALKVRDNRSPQHEGRSVSMLSGGEKFLVSLALSIGMSTVAQKSGVKIEALFIDEGFGTLDESSINDAMEVLEGVQKSNGTIGIISHVHLLEENIATHLEVLKTEKGSRIVLD